MNLTQRRYANRLQELIDESKNIALLIKTSSDYPFSYIEDQTSLNAWLIKVRNIVEVVFGSTSPHFRTLQELTQTDVSGTYQVNAIEGLLIGSLNDLENGFLLGQEFLIAGEIFDSVLEEAKHIFKTGYKDPAAVLGRVVLEDALKRLARQEQLNDTQKASILNDELKKAGKYNQPQWRQIQTWLDVGNSAAHGKFDEYSKEQVRDLIEGIERFIANEFTV